MSTPPNQVGFEAMPGGGGTDRDRDRDAEFPGEPPPGVETDRDRRAAPADSGPADAQQPRDQFAEAFGGLVGAAGRTVGGAAETAGDAVSGFREFQQRNERRKERVLSGVRDELGIETERGLTGRRVDVDETFGSERVDQPDVQDRATNVVESTAATGRRRAERELGVDPSDGLVGAGAVAGATAPVSAPAAAGVAVGAGIVGGGERILNEELDQPELPARDPTPPSERPIPEDRSRPEGLGVPDEPGLPGDIGPPSERVRDRPELPVPDRGGTGIGGLGAARQIGRQRGREQAGDDITGTQRRRRGADEELRDEILSGPDDQVTIGDEQPGDVLMPDDSGGLGDTTQRDESRGFETPREFPTGESAVVGRGQSVSESEQRARSVTQPEVTTEDAGPTLDTEAATQSTFPVVGADNNDGLIERARRLEEDAQRMQVREAAEQTSSGGGFGLLDQSPTEDLTPDTRERGQTETRVDQRARTDAREAQRVGLRAGQMQQQAQQQAQAQLTGQRAASSPENVPEQRAANEFGEPPANETATEEARPGEPRLSQPAGRRTDGDDDDELEKEGEILRALQSDLRFPSGIRDVDEQTDDEPRLGGAVPGGLL